MTLYVVTIVEGQTEQGCVERLLQRVWKELLGRWERLQVIEPFRGRRDQLVDPSGKFLAATVEKALIKLLSKSKRDADAVPLLMILIDAEKEGCPATLGPQLLNLAKMALPNDALISCVIANRMIENWIVAGASSLGGVNGLPSTLPVCADCENFGGAGWLDQQIRSVSKARKYAKTVDAEVFIRSMNVRDCHTNSPSFAKLCRELAARIPELPIDPNPVEPPPDESTR